MQDARDGLELRNLALAREADTDPRYRTGSEWYEYAVPPQQLNLQVVGDAVMEGAQEGGVDHDFGDRGCHQSSLPGFPVAEVSPMTCR